MSAFRDSLPTSQGKKCGQESEEGPQIPWILDPQEPRPSPAARSASRPETVLALEEESKIREWGIGNYSLFGSPGLLSQNGGHENEKVHLLARSKGAYGILNPIGVQDSVVPAPGKMDINFRCPAFRDSLPHHRVKVRPGERKRVPRFPGSWTLKSQDRLRPRGQPSRPETVLALEVQDPGNGGSVTTPSSALLAALCPGMGDTKTRRSIFLPGAREPTES